MRSREVDDAQGYYNHGDEIKELNINLENAEIECNGHRSKVESIELVEIMKCLKREVQSYRVDNERMIRDHEEHNQSNT
jgi:hypothetical protein